MATGYLEARFESGGPLNESGTGPFSTKTIYVPVMSFKPSPGVSHLLRDDENRNQDQPLTALPEAYDPSHDLEVRLYPDATGFFFTHTLGLPATIAGVNSGTVADMFGSVIPGGCWRHRWTAPFGPSGAFPYTTTFRVAYKDQLAYFTMKGAGAQSVSLETPEKGGARLKVSGPALVMQGTTDHALSPAYETLSIAPFMKSSLSIPAWVGLNQVATEDFTVNIDNPMDSIRSLGIASFFPDRMEKADTPVTFTGSIPKRNVGTADYQALVNATSFAGTARWQNQSSIGTTTFKYAINMAFAALQYTDGGPQALENARNLGQDLTFRAAYDGVTASVVVELVNATSSYT